MGMSSYTRRSAMAATACAAWGMRDWGWAVAGGAGGSGSLASCAGLQARVRRGANAWGGGANTSGRPLRMRSSKLWYGGFSWKYSAMLRYGRLGGDPAVGITRSAGEQPA